MSEAFDDDDAHRAGRRQARAVSPKATIALMPESRGDGERVVARTRPSRWS